MFYEIFPVSGDEPKRWAKKYAVEFGVFEIFIPSVEFQAFQSWAESFGLDNWTALQSGYYLVTYPNRAVTIVGIRPWSPKKLKKLSKSS